MTLERPPLHPRGTSDRRPFAPIPLRPARAFPVSALLASLALGGCDFFGQEPDEAPQAVGRIDRILLPEGRSADVDLSAHFRDPEGEALTFSASSSTPDVVAVATAGSIATVSALGPGFVTVVVTAMDPSGQSGQQAFEVVVPATPVIQLAAPHGEGPEADGAKIPLSLSAPPAVPITVRYTLGADRDDETADADESDFLGGVAGSLEIAAGATEAAIAVAFVDDDEIEPTREHFTITLDDPAADAAYKLGAAIRGAGAIAEGVCDRTPEVRDAILEGIEMDDCAAPRDESLREIPFLLVTSGENSSGWREDAEILPPAICDAESIHSPRATSGWTLPGATDPCAEPSDPSHDIHPPRARAATSGATTLKPKDFAGLDNLFLLAIVDTEIETLPPEIFSGLGSLFQLALVRNRLATLPAGIFDDQSSLYSLVLQSNQLTDLPDGVFSGLESLGQLLLDFNQLTRIPAEVGALASLEDFSVSSNRLSALPAQGPPALVSLHLGDNEFAEIPAGWLTASETLAEVYLQDNRIAALPAQPFPSLPNLRTLFLYNNEIDGIRPGTFANLPSLAHLILAGNRIEAIPPDAFANLDSLEWLALSDNRIAALPNDALEGLASLRRLWLSQNPIAELQAGTFGGLSELELLSLASTELTELDDELFADLDSLEILFLNEGELTALPPGLLRRLPSLERLEAPENRIAQLPEGFFIGHPGLRALDLSDNPGAPFPLNVMVARSDTAEILAPGPGRISARIPTGAPFNLKLPLAVHGGRSTAGSLRLLAGEETSNEATVERTMGEAGTQVSAGPPPRIPSGFTGISLEVGDPIVLFGKLDNHAPVALREIPNHRLRMGGDGYAFDGSPHFRDIDGDELTFTFHLSNPDVASVAQLASQVALEPTQPGNTQVTITATDPGGLSASLSFTVLVRGFIPGAYDMDLIMVDSMSAELEAIFESAAEWWMTILRDTELPDVPTGELSRLGCAGISSETTIASVDELVIVVATPEIDGRGGALAGATFCALREESMLPFMGVIQFDLDDLNWLMEEGQADEVEEIVLHEMGHVLGIGTLWDVFDLLRDPSLGGPADADTHYAGPLAVAAFDEAGGVEYEGGKVPVENEAGPGSGDSHWRQSVMVTELMTPYASIGVTDELSAITIQSLADLGYRVDVGLADPYRLPGVAAGALAGVERISLANDVLRTPVIVVDENGRVVGIARRN